MGLLDFLKGSSKPMASEISFEEARKTVFTELEDEEKNLLDFSSKKFAEIKHLLLSLSKSASFLESQKISLDKGNKTYRQIIATSQKNLSRQLKGLSHKLQPPQNFDVVSLQEYSSKANNSVQNDLLPYWKNISLTKLELKDEVNTIGTNLKELSESLKELNDFAFSKSMQKLRELKTIFSSIEENEFSLNDFKSKIKNQKSLIDSLEKKVFGLEKDLNDKSTSPAFNEFKKLEEKRVSLEKQKDDLVSSFNLELAPIGKVLKRLYSLSESSKLLPDNERELLRLILDSPSSAFTVDPKGLGSKNILIKAEKLVKEGSIVLKDKEKEKRLEVVSSLLKKDFFTDFFWRMNELQAELIQVRKRLTSLDISSELKGIENSIDSVRNNIQSEQHSLNKFLSDKEQSEVDLSKKNDSFVERFNSYYSGKFAIKQ